MMGGGNITFLSTKLVLLEVKSQASRVSETKGQIKNKPHCTEKLYHQQSWKTDSFACCNNTTQDDQNHTNICTDTYQSNNQI